MKITSKKRKKEPNDLFSSCFLLLFLKIVFENTKNIKNVLSENSSLFFKFSVFGVFFYVFSEKKKTENQTCFFPIFLVF